MSYRIHRAMGYGMPWKTFKEAIPDMDSEKLEEAFNKDFGVLKPSGSELSHAERMDLAELSIPYFNTGTFSHLYKEIGNPDYNTDIVFFPGDKFDTWFRANDDLDYAFELWRYGENEPIEPRDFVRYLNEGHYPYDNLPRLENGNPGIPFIIRWYLVNLGIMKDENVNKLRPLIAQWWS
jgi:hypothetical protein